MIHPSSFLFKANPETIIYYELVFTSKEFCRIVCEIEDDWLTEIAPHYYNQKMIKDMKSKTLKNKGTAEMKV